MNQSGSLKELLDNACREHVFSGYQFLAWEEKSILKICGGKTSFWENGCAVSEHTLFDIGSVTKPLVITSLLARGVQSGACNLEHKVERFVAEFKGTPLGLIELKALLNHSSGLVGWYPLFKDADCSDLIHWMKNNNANLISGVPYSHSLYSDIGFIILGILVERIFGDLDSAFQEQVIKPLGMREVQYGAKGNKQVVATEYCLFRKRLLQGEVFDENCYALGGRCGHAGIFATSGGLLPWCLEWLKAVKGNSSWLSRKIGLAFTTRPGWVAKSSWALGWDTKSEGYSSCGTGFSRNSFGHLGYPGCSVWVDPSKERIAIFLTNRIHPSRLDNRIRDLRPKVHDAWVSSVGGLS